jgi:hypothetical protein
MRPRAASEPRHINFTTALHHRAHGNHDREQELHNDQADAAHLSGKQWHVGICQQKAAECIRCIARQAEARHPADSAEAHAAASAPSRCCALLATLRKLPAALSLYNIGVTITIVFCSSCSGPFLTVLQGQHLTTGKHPE